ncbi:MAG: glutamine--fructose-6-phosphate aminotransferase, partial [Candidatus Thermoplasmatota archaeon]|nr:glutamine--fructose-6-phosphate aminotransferase [Candidatus Thermoplasmatota archaeon]
MNRVCGIVGYNGHRDALPILIEGLKRLEYRGYDSSGVVVIGDDLHVQKAAGEISVLEGRLVEADGTVGLGHTRWATHGKPTDLNAHPFVDCTGDLAIIHNGIVENYQSLKEELLEKGHKFVSETDTETLAHLFEDLYEGDLVAAVRTGLKRLEANYALGVVHKDHPDILVAARKENPLVVGISPAGETLLASDVTPLLEFTNEFIFVEDGDVVVLGDGTIEITDLEGTPIERPSQTVDWNVEDAQRGGFEHFMFKEIFEQPQ